MVTYSAVDERQEYRCGLVKVVLSTTVERAIRFDVRQARCVAPSIASLLSELAMIADFDFR